MSASYAAATTMVLVVAPPSLQRQGLLATLRDARPDLPIATTADTGALPERLQRKPPTLLILDAALRDVALDDLIEQLRRVCPRQRILVLGGKKLPFVIARLIVEMGGGVLLTKHATPADLLAAVARLIGEAAPDQPAPNEPDVAEPTIAYAAASSASPSPLVLFSPRELDVLRLVAADYTSQEIAARLCISLRTVDAHRRLLLEKAGARSMIGLVLQAVRSGWLTMT